MKNLRIVDTCETCCHVFEECAILFCNIDKTAPIPPVGTKWSQKHIEYNDTICDWGADKIVSRQCVCDDYQKSKTRFKSFVVPDNLRGERKWSESDGIRTFCVGIIFGFLSGVLCGVAIGAAMKRDSLDIEAAKAGAAEYQVDPKTGVTKFVWKTKAEEVK